ncbi:MAG: acyltransferase, partial [Chitinophagaceae bacterium]
MSERNYTIDLLRFIASSAVVLFHLNEPFAYVPNAYRDLAKQGWLGVPIFFVVSGYCIAMAAGHSKNPVDFFVRRFFRIFPSYWFSLLVVIGCVGFQVFYFGQNSVTVLPRSFKEISATLFLLTAPFSTIQTTNWVYWSLTVEIFFYLVIGLSLFLRKSFRPYAALAISIAALFPSLSKIPGLFFLSEWAAFGIGFSLYQVSKRKNISYPDVLILLVNSANLLFLEHYGYYAVTGFLTFSCIAISVFYKDLPRNLFSRAGDYSYSVYLLH